MADIEVVKRLVMEAGQRALKRFGSVPFEHKDDQTMVTDVDRQTELFLRDSLLSETPDYAFLGEEFGWHGPKEAPVWMCDPIDGTTNFVHGLAYWGVSAGLMVDAVPTLGVVYLPRLDELYWAERGKGAFCNGRPIKSTDRDSLHPEDTICLTSNSMKTLATEAIVARIRGLGSIASEMVCTASGHVSATIGLREGIVDMTAALCIGVEAGCVIRYLAGGELDFNSLINNRFTEQHFVFGPPRLVRHLQQSLRPRN